MIEHLVLNKGIQKKRNFETIIIIIIVVVVVVIIIAVIIIYYNYSVGEIIAMYSHQISLQSG